MGCPTSLERMWTATRTTSTVIDPMQIERGQRWIDPRYTGRRLVVVGITENRKYVECHLFERGRDKKQRALALVDGFASTYVYESSNHPVPPSPATPQAKVFYRRRRATTPRSIAR